MVRISFFASITLVGMFSHAWAQYDFDELGVQLLPLPAPNQSLQTPGPSAGQSGPESSRLSGDLLSGVAVGEQPHAERQGVEDLIAVLAGTWAPDGQCEARESWITIASDPIGDASWGRQGGAIVSSSHMTCRMFDPAPVDTGLSWSAECRVGNQTEQEQVSIRVDAAGLLEVEAPYISGTYSSCSDATVNYSLAQAEPVQPDQTAQPKAQNGERRSPSESDDRPDPYEAISGLYQIEAPCQERGNQGYVSIGRWDLDDAGQPLFGGDGLPGIAMPGGSCLLEGESVDGLTLSATAICKINGQDVTGPATLKWYDYYGDIQSPLVNGRVFGCPVQRVAPPPPQLVIEKVIGTGTRTIKTQAQRDAIVSVYANFCDPNFINQFGWPALSPDGTFAEQYRNQLAVRYANSCSDFYVNEVSPIIAMKEMQGLRPDLFQQPGSGLNDQAALAVGYSAYLSRQECQSILAEPNSVKQLAPYRALLRQLEAMSGQDDIEFASVGYGAAMLINAGMQQRGIQGECVAAVQIPSLMMGLLIRAGAIKE